jgi:TIGR03009 family protein
MMQYRWLSLTVLISASTIALAQQPPTQPPVPPQQPYGNPADKIDAILINWERAMSGINSLQAQVVRTTVDKVLVSTEVFSGDAKYVKPNKASLTLVNQKKQQEFEKLVCNGQIAYKWEPLQKEIHIHELPKPKQGQVSDDNFVSMLFGMKAIDAKRRYDLELLPLPPKEAPPNKAYYHYIQVLPREPQDKAEFTTARLVLSIETNLPRQISFTQPNGNLTTWDFPKVATNLAIDQREFAQPNPPGGWQLKRVTLPDGAPRVIRPQQQQKGPD